MARKTYNDGFADLIKRLNEMSNTTPEQERQELLEAAKKEPRVLDDRQISLADIAKLAGIKEFKEPTKISPDAEKLIESITGEKSDITKAIEESDKSISEKIIKEAKKVSNRLDKIAELEAKLAELKAEQKQEKIKTYTNTNSSSKNISINKIIAVNVGHRGTYHELVVEDS